jgi:hypothetical protein
MDARSAIRDTGDRGRADPCALGYLADGCQSILIFLKAFSPSIFA